jgi:hypothetical protein
MTTLTEEGTVASPRDQADALADAIKAMCVAAETLPEDDRLKSCLQRVAGLIDFRLGSRRLRRVT